MGLSSVRATKRRHSFSWNECRFRHRASVRNLLAATFCTLLVLLNVYQFQSNRQQQDTESRDHDDARQEAQENDRFDVDPWFANSDDKQTTSQKDDKQDPPRPIRREIQTQAPANKIDNNLLRRNDTLSDRPTFVTEEKHDHNFAHIIAVLQRMGFQKKQLAEGNDWDVYWTFTHPFYGSEWPDLRNLQPHQRVNHIPSDEGMTTKVVLAKSGISGIPPGFAIPGDEDKLRRYAKDNPDALFVKKGLHHRGISILKVEDLDIKNTNSFVQEFIRDPLLIDGYKFDIGVYTIVTSVDPLRVFIYDADVILRFCPEKYLPLDSANLDKYVVAERWRNTWEIEPLKKYYIEMGMSMKDTLNAYITSLGKDPSVIWTKFEEVVRSVLLRNERHWIEGLRNYKSKRNFFELFRLDFIVSEDLDVHLMEINISPNLNSVKFPIYRQRYEQLLFNTFSLLNIARKTRSNSLRTSSIAEHEMTVFEKNLGVFPEKCSSALCRGSCEPLDCKLCKRCLTADTRQMLEDAFIEDQNRMSCKRIIPPEVTYKDANKPLGELSEANQLMLRWFQGKCLLDKGWCSP